MKIEELDGLDFPFKVKVSFGKYKDQIVSIYNIRKSHANRIYLMPENMNKVKADTVTELHRGGEYRSNGNYIHINNCELVKEPAYQDIKEVYKNLTKEDLKEAVFVEINSDRCDEIISEYGKVWFELNAAEVAWLNYYDIKAPEKGFAKKCVRGDLYELYFPFLAFTEEQRTDLREGNSIGEGWAKILDPTIPDNAKILENKFDTIDTQENMPVIQATEEIDLFQ